MQTSRYRDEVGRPMYLSSEDVIYLRDRWDKDVRAEYRRVRFWACLWGFFVGVLFAVLSKMTW